LKEKLNFLQNNEEGLENNSMIQEIQDSEMFSKIEETQNDEFATLEKEENVKKEVYSLQERENFIKTDDFLTLNEQEEEDALLNKKKSLGETCQNNNLIIENNSERHFIKKKLLDQERNFEKELEINIDNRIDEKINERMKQVFEIINENERKIKLLERKLLSFEEVKIQ